MPRILPVLLACATLAAPVFATAQRERALLEKVVSATESTVFAGVRVITINGRNGKQTITERVLKSGRSWVITYKDDSPYAGQKVYESPKGRFTYSAAKNEIRQTPSRIEEETNGLRRILKDRVAGGELKAVAGIVVADKQTVGLQLSAGGRGKQIVYIDPQQNTILKWSFLNLEGKEVGGFEYTQIQYNVRIASTEFVMPAGVKIIRVADDLVRLAKEAGLKPYSLSPRSGFNLINVSLFRHEERAGVRSFYANGDKRVTLIVFKGTGHVFGSRSSNKIKMFRWENEGNTFVLIGDADEAELQRLSRHVRA